MIQLTRCDAVTIWVNPSLITWMYIRGDKLTGVHFGRKTFLHVKETPEEIWAKIAAARGQS